jgi:AcrR family transcriptional regulator
MRSENGPRLTRIQRARREDVIAAAITVLDRDGFAAASVERIAAAAETSKGTVLYHFTSKEALFQAVVEALYASGSAYMTERIMAAPGPRAMLHAYIDSNLRFIAEHAAHVNAVHRIVENAAGTVGGFDDVTPLRNLLAAGQAAGELGAFDPEVVALAIRAVVDGASFYFTAHPDLDIDHHVDEAVRLFDKATST